MGMRMLLWVLVNEGTVSRVEGEAPRNVLPGDAQFASWIRLGWKPVSAAASSLPGHDVIVVEHAR
jgi:hypothetical protein